MIPETLKDCSEYPIEPDDPDAPDFDTNVSVFMLRSQDAWRDCRETLHDLVATIDEQQGIDNETE